jgi:hypothetical protein
MDLWAWNNVRFDSDEFDAVERYPVIPEIGKIYPLYSEESTKPIFPKVKRVKPKKKI